MTPRAAVIVWLLVVAAVVSAGLLASRPSRGYGDAGTNDFIEYWAASRIAAAGGNPYDPAQLLVVEQAVGRPDDVPLMMWNPPWLLMLMRPVLWAPFGLAATLWIGMNILIVAVSTVLITLGCRLTKFEARDLPPALLGGVASVPVALSIGLGQVSLLLLLAVAGLYWALRFRHDATAGVALAVLSVKPHLFLMVFVLMAVVILRERRWRIAEAALVAMAFSLIGTTIESPTLLADWWMSVVAPPSGVPAPTSWSTPNIPNLIRNWVAGDDGVRPLWPLAAVPATAVALGAVVLWPMSRRRPVDDLLPPVLCLSVALAPFGWTFDQVVLTVPQVILFLRGRAELDRTRRWLLWGAVIGCQLALVAQAQIVRTDYSGFWWFPPAMLMVWSLSQRMSHFETTVLPPREGIAR